MSNFDKSMGDWSTEGGHGSSSVSALELSLGDFKTHDEGSEEILAKVDRYELISELGRGGFGAVFLGKDTISDQLVALKTLPPELNHSPEELEAVRENFKLIANLNHPNIAAAKHLHKVEDVQTFAPGIYIDSNEYLLVMEYVEGSTLSNWKRQFDGRKVPFEKTQSICEQVAKALDYAHSQKIIHRDIKPGNIMIDAKGHVKVLDFGLAAEIRSSMSRVSQDKGDTSGTRPYMAPEQWSGCKQGPQTDQYALAVLFYELLSGEVPFQSIFETGDTVLMAQCVERNMPNILSDVSKKQWKAISRALSKSSSERYSNCSLFIDVVTGRSSVPLGSEKFLKKVLASIALIGLVLASIIFYTKGFNNQGARLSQEQLEKKNRVTAELLNSEVEVVWSGMTRLLEQPYSSIHKDKLKASLSIATGSFNEAQYEQSIKLFKAFLKDCESLKAMGKLAESGALTFEQLKGDYMTEAQVLLFEKYVPEKWQKLKISFNRASVLYKNGEFLEVDKQLTKLKQDFSNLTVLRDTSVIKEVTELAHNAREKAKNVGADSSSKKLWNSANQKLSTALITNDSNKAVDLLEKSASDFNDAAKNAIGAASVLKASKDWRSQLRKLSIKKKMTMAQFEEFMLQSSKQEWNEINALVEEAKSFQLNGAWTTAVKKYRKASKLLSTIFDLAHSNSLNGSVASRHQVETSTTKTGALKVKKWQIDSVSVVNRCRMKSGLIVAFLTYDGVTQKVSDNIEHIFKYNSFTDRAKVEFLKADFTIGLKMSRENKKQNAKILSTTNTTDFPSLLLINSNYQVIYRFPLSLLSKGSSDIVSAITRVLDRTQ